jgi:iron(III) transport system substrate-binding protein
VSRRAGYALALLSALPWLAAAHAEPPPPTPVTQGLIDAATREGRIAWYTAIDLAVAERLVDAFQAKYPGITVQLQRSGAERNFARIGQEYDAGIHVADVIDSSDAAHFIVWKHQGWLAPYVPDDVARYWAPALRDPDGQFATWRMTLSVMGYNSRLVAAADAPQSFADLLDPKWSGKIVKAHPGYSGTILTATFQMVRALGWGYFERLSKQRVLQVQSAVDPPKKLAAGERPIMADGSEAALIFQQDAGQPVMPIYPAEGTPVVTSPSGILKDAPHPNAARLFQSYVFSLEGQQLIVDASGFRAVHPLVQEKPGRRKLGEIKLMTDDPAGVEAAADALKKRYTQYFRV